MADPPLPWPCAAGDGLYIWLKRRALYVALDSVEDCSARARGRLLFDRTTGVSPKHTGHFRFRMRSQRQRVASNAPLDPLAKAEVSNSRAAALYLSLYPWGQRDGMALHHKVGIAVLWDRISECAGSPCQAGFNVFPARWLFKHAPGPISSRI